MCSFSAFYSFECQLQWTVCIISKQISFLTLLNFYKSDIRIKMLNTALKQKTFYIMVCSIKLLKCVLNYVTSHILYLNNLKWGMKEVVEFVFSALILLWCTHKQHITQKYVYSKTGTIYNSITFIQITYWVSAYLKNTIKMFYTILI